MRPVETHRRGPGYVVWLTGLSGAGKSSVARQLAARLRERGERVEVLDGDEIREHLSQGLGFSREDRDTNIRRLAFVARLLVRNGVVVIVAAISPYRAARDEARRSLRLFIEVYVHCPVEELIRRDTKGLYARALRAEVPHFTGINDPYEPPLSPEVTIYTHRESVDESVAKLLDAIELLPAAADLAAAF